jgi:hypothetical protein
VESEGVGVKRLLSVGMMAATTIASSSVDAQTFGVLRNFDEAKDAVSVRALLSGCSPTESSDPVVSATVSLWSACALTKPFASDAEWPDTLSRLRNLGHVMDKGGTITAVALYGTNPRTDVMLHGKYKLAPVNLILFNPQITGADTMALAKSLTLQMMSAMQAAGYDGLYANLPVRFTTVPGFSLSSADLAIHSDVIGVDPLTGHATAWQHWLLFTEHLPQRSLEAAMSVEKIK